MFSLFHICRRLNNCLLSNVSYISLLILYALMDSSLWFDAINLEWSIVYSEGLHDVISS